MIGKPIDNFFYSVHRWSINRWIIPRTIHRIGVFRYSNTVVLFCSICIPAARSWTGYQLCVLFNEFGFLRLSINTMTWCSCLYPAVRLRQSSEVIKSRLPICRDVKFSSDPSIGIVLLSVPNGDQILSDKMVCFFAIRLTRIRTI